MNVNQRFDEMLDAHRNEEPSRAIAAACDVSKWVESDKPTPYGLKIAVVLDLCFDVVLIARTRCTPADFARLAC